MKKLKLFVGVLLLTMFLSAYRPMPTEAAVAAPAVEVTIDFHGYCDGNTVLFIDHKGQATLFSSWLGMMQTKKMKPGRYTVVWGIMPAQSSSCQVRFGLTLSGLFLPERPGYRINYNIPIGADGVEEYFSFDVNCR